MFKIKFFAVLTTICYLSFSILSPVVAQDNSGLRVSTSPLPINLTTSPGKTVTTDLRIRNSGSKTEEFQVGLLKFNADSTTGSPTLKEREAGDDYFEWVSFNPNKLTLDPNEWGTIKMTITVPTSAAFGYYYAVTFGRSNELPDEGSTALLGAAATLVLLEVDVPGAKREVEIEQFATTKSWYEFLPVEFLVRLRNTGNVHVAPFGSVFIEQNGEQVASLPFNQGKGNILPDSPRNYSVEWRNGFPVYTPVETNGQSTKEARQQLSWDFTKANQLRFGKYTANLVIAYDNGERDVPLQQSVEFWVIPWRMLAGGAVVILFFGIGVFMFGRSVWRRMSQDRGDV